MATYTNLGIKKITTGDESGTWGTSTNTNFDLFDTAIVGYSSVSLASAGSSGSPNTLSVSDFSASDGRNRVIEFTDAGDLGATAYVQIDPNDFEGYYFIRNSLSASRSILLFQGTYDSARDYELLNGKDYIIRCTGTGATSYIYNIFEDVTFTLITQGDSTTPAGGWTQLGAMLSTDTASGVNLIVRKSNTGSNSPAIGLFKSRGTAASPTIVSASDGVFNAQGCGFDGSNYIQCVQITGEVDGTPGTNDMPGRLMFSTTADGASSPTERMRIDSSGNVGIGTAAPSHTLDVIGDIEVSSQIFLDSPSTSYAFNCGGQGAFDSNLWTLSNIYTVPVAGTTPSINDNDASRVGTHLSTTGYLNIARVSGPMLVLNRKTTDGQLVIFRAQGTTEGYITVSGTTVSYVGFMGSHWGSLEDRSTPDILPGTILETIDKLIEWKIAVFEKDGVTIRMAYNGSANAGDTVQITYEGQQYLALIQEEQPDQELNKHVCVKVNDTPASPAVFGVFLDWESDPESEEEDEDGIKGKWNDMQVASLGNYFIRIAANETISIGDLIEADGTGCGRVQSDDIIRSKTVGKITSTIKQKVYADGSYLVTAVLHCG